MGDGQEGPRVNVKNTFIHLEPPGQPEPLLSSKSAPGAVDAITAMDDGQEGPRVNVKNTFIHLEPPGQPEPLLSSKSAPGAVDAITEGEGPLAHLTEGEGPLAHLSLTMPAVPVEKVEEAEREGEECGDVWHEPKETFASRFTRKCHKFHSAGRGPLAKGEYMVMLEPKAKNRRRGGSSFGNSAGLVFVKVKCNSSPMDATVVVSVQVGKQVELVKRHNFEKLTLCQWETPVNFLDHVNKQGPQTGKVTITLSLTMHALTLWTWAPGSGGFAEEAPEDTEIGWLGPPAGTVAVRGIVHAL